MTAIIEECKVKWALKKELLPFFEKYDTLQVKETVSHSDHYSLKDKITAVSSEAFKASLSNDLVAIETKIEESEKKEKELKEEKAKIEKGANKKISPAAGKSFCTYSFQ